jgi:hypothetical protein
MSLFDEFFQLFKPNQPHGTAPGDGLDMPVLAASPADFVTWRDVCDHTLIMSQSGGGKSSGPFKAWVRDIGMKFNAGVVLSTSKSQDVSDYREWAGQAGRERHVICFGPDFPQWRFNWLEYVSALYAGAGREEVIVGLLSDLVSVAQRRSSQGGGNDEYFTQTSTILLRNGVSLLSLAGKPVTVLNLWRLIGSIAESAEEAETSSRWRRESFCFACLCEAKERVGILNPAQRHDLEIIAQYFMEAMPRLSNRTRSIVYSCVQMAIDPFTRGWLHQALGTDTTFVPDMLWGEPPAILILAMPTLAYPSGVGRFFQILMKGIVQKALQKRDLARNDRIVMIACDEVQEVLSLSDAEFLNVSRGLRVANCFCCQNLPTLYRALGGGDAAQHYVNSLLGNMAVKIFGVNGCHVTNQWAADTIGRHYRTRVQTGMSDKPEPSLFTSSKTHSASTTTSLEHEILPGEFARLRRGGPPGFVVETVLFQSGRIFNHSRKPYLKGVLFSQK